ncbi:hypothetical protein COS93_02360 [bacterium (Candidatus Gribaldobacteria) CG07_land_8_20_14_0_80_33_18]|uniref:Phage holin family protein n=1 Tax=bacterium (Candidatus Gribaldobacteria) CG07_land_8_20_14_0_80_33_18 TaxID=2014272 RepID=A0A2M6Z2A0_9BACT|nr:MAG: hypothetical protein COS93_02360 [bacterium (Candidatus Gribaldobacteria) CG07_land_8_20_14_0_80_33_18]PJA01138.1 MAG: hypothetical protein COX75_00690 [bacterium (Candidatus Gribaldobacteria) CG_4_10_14_0_2_um_filter_33_15]PJB08816.1 MAG: hypothetical protein CO122_00800 [bacterium (Candidatus Gribaldobacteria) CG_4_9_14_3_um_filter_33_9]
MIRLFWYIILGTLGIYIAILFIPGVQINGEIYSFGWSKILFLSGLVLGLLNFFIKPIISLITFPLRILTLGLFSLAIEMGMVFIVDTVFPELIIPGLAGLFWTSIIVWLLGFAVPKKDKIKAIE